LDYTLKNLYELLVKARARADQPCDGMLSTVTVSTHLMRARVDAVIAMTQQRTRTFGTIWYCRWSTESRGTQHLTSYVKIAKSTKSDIRLLKAENTLLSYEGFSQAT